MTSPVHAQEFPREAMLDFFGGQGCTFSFSSVRAAVDAGFAGDDLQMLSLRELLNGTATEQGDYVVFDASICTIRPPDIQSDLSVSDPFIQSITLSFDHFDVSLKGEELFEGEDRFGCFLLDPSDAFDVRAGGERGAGFDDYISFIASGMIAGDVRFYSPSPLTTPYSTQVMTGTGCDSVPNVATVMASHSYFASGFGEYVRFVGAQTECGERLTSRSSLFTAKMQGLDVNDYMQGVETPEDQQPINAWLWFEFDIITMAAGWHEGMSGSERGTPRPPLCHYPTQ